MDHKSEMPKLVGHQVYQRDQTPEITIVIPVFNQSRIIRKNLEALFLSTENSFELIIIDDASTDGTSSEILNFLSACHEIVQDAKVTEVFLYRFSHSVFETRCDDFGMRSGKANYFLEIQADMRVYEKGFDTKLLDALRSSADLFMISGRGTEPIDSVVKYYRNTLGSDRSTARNVLTHIFLRSRVQLKHHLKRFLKWNLRIPAAAPIVLIPPVAEEDMLVFEETFRMEGKAGRLDTLLESLPTNAELEDRRIWLGQTVMRGPLIIDGKKYAQVGGLDVKAFFQGFDDHDLVLRSYQDFGFRVGYVPIGFSSPLGDGSTRHIRSISSEIQILSNLLRIRKKWKNSRLFLYANTNSRKLPAPEVRRF